MYLSHKIKESFDLCYTFYRLVVGTKLKRSNLIDIFFIVFI